ncbi:hypothetical protein BO85DRAFT_95992 [Aspergillus piperis CBS 112811]|uniref:Uncharacterized protein n=1 Tax=Aspergillus piperis CBS 112811 TaxID=1448313 RepID=A0A8G1QW19_9EURO|nr:hypothetical protein BO85DRAFT_95992 [Aspergillus piperis CBS 112811]RAH54693.1 hypothetical protein BO85DRAFT_95992 [Aspergillus piperis CBS 112811]
MPGAAVNEEHLAPPPPRLFTNRDSEALEQYSAAIPWLPPTKEAFDRQFTDPIERILTGGLADPPIKRRNLDDAFYCIASLLPDMISQFTELKDNVIRPSFLILNAVASFAHCATESTELLRSCRTVITREGVARDNIEVTTTVRRVNSFLNAMGKLMAEKKTKCSTLETSLEESARRISGHSSSFDAGLRNMGANWQNACRLYYEASMRSIAALLSAEYRNWEGILNCFTFATSANCFLK